MVRLPESEAVPALDTFEVELEVFQGPFDLLLQLIARRQLDITQVSLSQVTDEFIEHMKRVPDLSTMTEFLVVAATLLEMKAAQLLPQMERDSEMEEDLSARDLLFSRLLQYKAFKGAASVIEERLAEQSGAFPRLVPLEPQFALLLPELVWATSATQLAHLASLSLSERPRPDEAEHVNRPTVSLEEEVSVVQRRLQQAGSLTFTDLVKDVGDVAVVVTRFLAVLELFRRGEVAFDQPVELGPLHVTWATQPDAQHRVSLERSQEDTRENEVHA